MLLMSCVILRVYCFKWEEKKEMHCLTALEIPASVFKGWKRKLKIWMIKGKKITFVEATLNVS